MTHLLLWEPQKWVPHISILRCGNSATPGEELLYFLSELDVLDEAAAAGADAAGVALDAGALVAGVSLPDDDPPDPPEDAPPESLEDEPESALLSLPDFPSLDFGLALP